MEPYTLAIAARVLIRAIRVGCGDGRNSTTAGISGFIFSRFYTDTYTRRQWGLAKSALALF